MSMNGEYGQKIRVKYIGERTYEFDPGDIVEAGFLKNDPFDRWYVIKGRDGEDEYAFPRSLFDVVSE